MGRTWGSELGSEWKPEPSFSELRQPHSRGFRGFRGKKNEANISEATFLSFFKHCFSSRSESELAETDRRESVRIT